jgi:hypothetical protein
VYADAVVEAPRTGDDDPSNGDTLVLRSGYSEGMGMQAIQVRWTRAELVAVREAIEVTPLFEGRAEVRETVRRTLRANGRSLTLDVTLAERLASHLVPIDMPTAIAKVKLLRTVRDARRESAPAAARSVEAA